MKYECLSHVFHVVKIEIMMQRVEFIGKIKNRFKSSPCVALLGPRQCGKTTLARQYLQQTRQAASYFDLQDPVALARLDEPMLALKNAENLIVIDEIQLRPDLFPILRVLIDSNTALRFLILGSASRDLIRQSSETLAGRISYIECTPFTLSEVHDSNKMLARGGFPRSFLAGDDAASYQWRQDYIATFLERDIPNLGFRIPPQTMRRFWMMLTHYHGQIFNASELGKSLGLAHTTTRHYLDILVGTFIVRELLPWHENINKRQVKSPKIYFRDPGLYQALLGIHTKKQLQLHPKLGALWEGYAMEQIISAYGVSTDHCFFWAVHQQAEIDLLLNSDGAKIGFEFKYQDAPKMTRSMRIACEQLKLDKLIVIYPGDSNYQLTPDITVANLENHIDSL